MSDIKLPPLDAPFDMQYDQSDRGIIYYYSTAKVEAYARQCVLAERAARAKTVGVTFKELTLKARIVELEGEIESLLAPTEDMEIAGMEASVLGRPSVDDPAYVLSIYKAMIEAAPTQERGADDE